ncbi:hypothetical protein ACLE20_02965 [Rhizobium sp. YIM 134829]|uniref:hypothetical protein n=1 Tax=Rhizobium sp. YIM 134829 TaxID=3390453 RepID=UPI0039798B4B
MAVYKQPLETVREGDRVQVHARVSGNFPGSPIMLTHHFTLKSDQILRLEFH